MKYKNTSKIKNFEGVPLKKRKKDKDWYAEIRDFYLPPYSHAYSDDYNRLKRLYEFFNNDLSSYQEDLNRMCNSLIDFGAAQEELKSYNKLRNKFEVLAGDLLSKTSTHNIVLLSQNAIKRKDQELAEKIMQEVEAELQRTIQEFQPQLQNATPEQIEKFLSEFKAKNVPKDLDRKSFMSQIERYKFNMLRYAKIEQDIASKKVDTFKHLFISDRMFLLNTWVNGKPKIEILNPLFCGFDKNPNEKNVSKGDYFWYEDEMTIADVLDTYGNTLNEKELNEILLRSSYYNTVNKDDISKFKVNKVLRQAMAAALEGHRGNYDSGIGQYQVSGDNTPNLDNGYIRRRRLWFKAYDPIIIYTYTNDRGERVSTMLDEKADVIPQDAEEVTYTNRWHEKDTKYIWTNEYGEEFEAEIIWIPRRYEMTVLGDDLMIEARRMPHQPSDPEEPFSSFSLPVKGGVMNAMNAESTSLMENVLPYQLQILALNHLFNREMSKYRGFEINQDADQIPKELGLDEDGDFDFIDAVLKNEAFARALGSRFFSGSQTKNNLPMPHANRGSYATPMMFGASAELVNLKTIIDMIDSEMGVAMGVSKSREGEMTKYVTAAANQTSLQQSSLVTQIYFKFHSDIWAQSLDEHLINIDTYWKNYFESNPSEDNTLIEYITPEGTRELITIMPDFLNHYRVGIFIGDANQDQIYNDYMLQRADFVAQNPESAEIVSSLIKTIASGSSKEEVHKAIQDASAAMAERQQAMTEQQEQLRAQAMQKQREDIIFEKELDTQQELIKQEARKETELEKARINATERMMAKDIDKDNVNDDIQKEEVKINAQREENEKDRKHQMTLEEKKIAAQKEIARMNKNKSQ